MDIVTVTKDLPDGRLAGVTVGGATTNSRSSQFYLREHRNQQVEAKAPASGESDDTHMAVLQYRTQVYVWMSQGMCAPDSQTLN